jgi:hypothetical protein
MLGQHPGLYSIPETQLFLADTMADWWALCSRAKAPLAHGLLRTVAQLYFGEQTEETVKLARGWLMRRSHYTTGYLLEELAIRVFPAMLVDKGSIITYRLEFLRRAYRMFPGARFLHMVRHPKGYGESVIKYYREREKSGPLPPGNWLLHLAAYPNPLVPGNKVEPNHRDLDPQRSWYALNMNISEFLKSVPDDQKMLVRGEDLLSNTDERLQQILCWLGLRADDDAIEPMKHPERSPYAGFGPPGARFGNDRNFMSNPVLRPDRATPPSLDGPVSWYSDGRVLLPEVKQLAGQFGYQ